MYGNTGAFGILEPRQQSITADETPDMVGGGGFCVFGLPANGNVSSLCPFRAPLTGERPRL